MPGTPGIAETMDAGAKPAFRSLDNNTVHLRVNQAVDRTKALKIIQMLEDDA